MTITTSTISSEKCIYLVTFENNNKRNVSREDAKALEISQPGKLRKLIDDRRAYEEMLPKSKKLRLNKN